jgi:hypothetical protein
MKRFGWIVATVTGTVAVIGAGAPAAAQVFALNPTTMVGYAGVAAAGQHARRQIGTRIAQRQPVRTSVSPAQVVARASFRPNPAVRNQVYARTVALAGKMSADDAAKLRGLFASGKFRTEITKYMSPYGMSPNNVVDATALYLASAWYASRANSGDPTPAQMRGLRRQVALAMAATPGMLTASDALKQEIAEASLIQAMFSGSLAIEGAKNPAASGPMRAAAVNGVKASYQIDLSRMNLTANGLQ